MHLVNIQKHCDYSLVMNGCHCAVLLLNFTLTNPQMPLSPGDNDDNFGRKHITNKIKSPFANNHGSGVDWKKVDYTRKCKSVTSSKISPPNPISPISNTFWIVLHTKYK